MTFSTKAPRTRWHIAPHGESATGAGIASPLGQVSWAMFDFARNPYVLLITIYLFAPYFTNVLMHDPVEGQAVWGNIQGYAGITIALLAPFLGAIADAGGRRKPWIVFFAIIMAAHAPACGLPKPLSSGWAFRRGREFAVANVVLRIRQPCFTTRCCRPSHSRTCCLVVGSGFGARQSVERRAHGLHARGFRVAWSCATGVSSPRIPCGASIRRRMNRNG